MRAATWVFTDVVVPFLDSIRTNRFGWVEGQPVPDPLVARFNLDALTKDRLWAGVKADLDGDPKMKKLTPATMKALERIVPNLPAVYQKSFADHIVTAIDTDSTGKEKPRNNDDVTLRSSRTMLVHDPAVLAARAGAPPRSSCSPTPRSGGSGPASRRWRGGRGRRRARRS